MEHRYWAKQSPNLVQYPFGLHLVDLSLIGDILKRRWPQLEANGMCSVQELADMLKLLFNAARREEPGTELVPFSSDLLPLPSSLSQQINFPQNTELVAQWSALSSGHRGGGSNVTRSALRMVLHDLQQIPAAVCEGKAFEQLENAIHSCFQGVLTSGISEQMFFSWLQSEPQILSWLPTLYRVSATEAITHQAKCSICKRFPITGFRYQCLKCLNYDLCQVCFFTDQTNKRHKSSHPVMEHCTQTSMKENLKLFVRTVRNNLLTARCKRKEARRRAALITVRTGYRPAENRGCHVEEPPSLPSASHNLRGWCRSDDEPWGLGPAAGYGAKVSKAQQTDPSALGESRWRPGATLTRTGKIDMNSKCDAPMRRELRDTRAIIGELQQEKWFLEQQLQWWKWKAQSSDSAPTEEKQCSLKEKIAAISAQNQCLQQELQPLRQLLQLHQQTQGGLSQRGARHSVKDLEPPGEVDAIAPPRGHGKRSPGKEKEQQAARAKGGWDEISSTGKSILSESRLPPVVGLNLTNKSEGRWCLREPSNHREGLVAVEDTGCIIIQRTDLARAPQPVTVGSLTQQANLPDEGEDEEEELHQLVEKLKDALSLKVKAGHCSIVKQELLNAAEHVGETLSQLVSQVATPVLP
eukprot:gi/632947329/ref/XP_007888994.1/ PREDICTED: dystrotelin [Callorhinchus milii]